MMPFSAEFYKEMDVRKNKSDSGSSSQPVSRTCSSLNIPQQITTIISTQSPSSSLYVASLSENHVLIGVPEPKSLLYVSGFTNVKVLKGNVVANGLTLTEYSRKHRILCPIWQPAYPLFCDNGSDRKHGKVNQSLAAYLKEYDIHLEDEKGRKPYKQDLFNEFPVVISVQGMNAKDMEWILLAEDQTMYAPSEAVLPAPHSITIYTAPSLVFRESDIAKVHTAMIGNFRGLTQNRADCMTLSKSWRDAGQHICDHYTTRNKKATKVILCGSKGVGKSTYLRYIANRLLSAASEGFRSVGTNNFNEDTEPTGLCNADMMAVYATSPNICILDCDLGQPELSTPGSVSLHVISSNKVAFLSAPHLNLQTADTSFFVGDVTNKYEPTLVLEFIRRLFVRYEEIATKVSALQEQQRKAAAKKFVAKNSFNALMMEDSSDNSENSDNESDDSHENDSDKHNTRVGGEISPSPMPLLVNLDGYVKNMGAEVLESIIAMVKPTHAVHIASEKDRALIPLATILGLAASDMDSSATVSSAPVGTSSGAKITDKSTERNGTSESESSTVPACEILELEPGRYYTAPRVAAVDLRSLRLVSYFMRQDTNLCFSAQTELPRSSSRKSFSSLPRSGSSEQLKKGGSNSSSAVGAADASSVAQRSSPDCSVLVRNGAVVDPTGLLAVQLVSNAPFSVPFARAVLCTIPSCGDLPPRLLLAALNASLVGIVLIPDNSGVRSEATSSEIVLTPTVSWKRLRHPEGDIEINFTTDIPMTPCVGMGIVRAVDIASQRIFLITNVSEAVLNQPNTRVCLVKGNNAQLPTVLTYSPLFPCFPYMSSESTGEGSAQLRTRNNVKRRAQQQNC